MTRRQRCTFFIGFESGGRLGAARRRPRAKHETTSVLRGLSFAVGLTVVRATIAALNVYPVKSCRGLAADRAEVTPAGLAIDGVRDREWMVVDSRGRFVTQRELPRLALIGIEALTAGCMLHVPGLDPVAAGSAGGGARRRRLERARARSRRRATRPPTRCPPTSTTTCGSCGSTTRTRGASIPTTRERAARRRSTPTAIRCS